MLVSEMWCPHQTRCKGIQNWSTHAMLCCAVPQMKVEQMLLLGAFHHPKAEHLVTRCAPQA